MFGVTHFIVNSGETEASVFGCKQYELIVVQFLSWSVLMFSGRSDG